MIRSNFVCNRVPILYRSLSIPNYITRQKCGVKWYDNWILMNQIWTYGLPLVHATKITRIHDLESGKWSWKTEKFSNKNSKKLCRDEVDFSDLTDMSKSFLSFESETISKWIMISLLKLSKSILHLELEDMSQTNFFVLWNCPKYMRSMSIFKGARYTQKGMLMKLGSFLDNLLSYRSRRHNKWRKFLQERRNSLWHEIDHVIQPRSRA